MRLSLCVDVQGGIVARYRGRGGRAGRVCCFIGSYSENHFLRTGTPLKTCHSCIMDALVYLRKKRGAGGRGEATTGESVLATPLWGILYAGDASVVSRPPEQLRKMMEVIEVVCAAFGLTVSEAKTENIYLRAKGMPESTATFSVEAAGQVYNQTNEFVYLGGNVNHNADPSMEVDRRDATHGAASGCTPSNCTTD